MYKGCLLYTPYGGILDRVNFHLSEVEQRGLQVLSEVTGLKKAEIIRRALDSYIHQKKAQGVTGLQNVDVSLV